jgi:hypothetical protein
MGNYARLKDWYRHIKKASYRWLLCLLPVLVVMVITACQQTKASDPVAEAKALIPDPSEPLQFETKPYVYKPEEGKENYRYGFIDRSGKFVIPPKFLSAYCFKGGLASVTTDAGDTYVDKTGRFVTKPGEYYTGPKNSSCDDNWPNYHAEGLYLISKKTKVPESKGSQSKQQVSSANGYVNARGKLVIPLKPYYADDFSEGMAQITVYADVSQEEIEDGKRRNDATANVRHGYIDKTGKVVIPPQFHRADAFRWGVAKVGSIKLVPDPENPGQKKATFYSSFIDKQGKYLVEPTQTSSQFHCPDFSKSFRASGTTSEYIQTIKKSCLSEEIKDEPRDGFVKLDIPIPPSTTDINYMLTNQAGKKLFRGINMSGPGPYYQRVEYGINEGLALIERDDGMKCFIDNQGNFVIPCKFKEATAFTEGLAAVAIDTGPKKPEPPKSEIPVRVFIKETPQAEPER